MAGLHVAARFPAELPGRRPTGAAGRAPGHALTGADQHEVLVGEQEVGGAAGLRAVAEPPGDGHLTGVR